MSIVAWLKRLKRRRLDDEDFKEEIRAHLAIAADERMADGADRQTAHYAALKEFGNVTLTTEAARRVWTPWWLDALHDLVSDVRYAIRALAKNPAFSLTVVGVLTLGIGLNAAVFTMLKGIALSPLAGVDGSARLARHLRRNERGTSAPRVVSRLPVPPRSRSRVLGTLRLDRRHRQPGQRPKRPLSSGASSSPATTFRSSAFVPSAAARSCRRTRSRPAAIRSSSSAMVCGGATSAPIRTSSARRSRSTTTR